MLTYLRQGMGKYLRENIVKYFFAVLVFMIGIVIGAMAIRILPEAERSELAGYLNVYLGSLSSGALQSSDLIGSVIFTHLKTLAVIWGLGFTLIGLPFILLIILLRGVIIGFTVGFLVNEFVFKGLLLALVAVLPHNFLAIPILLVMSVSAMNFSLRLLQHKEYHKQSLLYAALSYSGVWGILCIGMVFSSLLEVYISPVFMRWIVNWFS